MISQTVGELTLLRFDTLADQPGLAHAVTTRPQNYAPHRGEGREQAIRWRHEVCDLLGAPFESLTSPEQVHGAEVLAVEPFDVGRGRDGRQGAVQFVDGLITDRPGVPLIILSADCPLICAYDPDRPAAGAVHASWRGTVAGASENLIRQMVRSYGSDSGRLKTAISPSAGPCCYEVGQHVRRVARTRLVEADSCFVERDGRVFFDLWTANRRQLLASGVRAENIEVAGACSICDHRFWSHRRDGDNAGRFALFISLV
jgi:polyphenol oxidase